jgi:hypothetical protein
MITTHRMGLALVLTAGLGLSGCGSIPAEIARSWAPAVVLHPKAPSPQSHAAHRHKSRVVRHAPRMTPEPIDQDLVTGSVTPVAAPATPKSLLEACKQRLYLETATSTEELRAAEVACKDVIVNAPIGAGAN